MGGPSALWPDTLAGPCLAGWLGGRAGGGGGCAGVCVWTILCVRPARTRAPIYNRYNLTHTPSWPLEPTKPHPASQLPVSQPASKLIQHMYMYHCGMFHAAPVVNRWGMHAPRQPAIHAWAVSVDLRLSLSVSLSTFPRSSRLVLAVLAVLGVSCVGFFSFSLSPCGRPGGVWVCGFWLASSSFSDTPAERAWGEGFGCVPDTRDLGR